MKLSLLTATQHPAFRDSESDENTASEQTNKQEFVKTKRSDLLNGLTRRQRTFILEKLVGLNDKDAALSAGYSLSVAENTKQRIWKPRVRAESGRLRCEIAARLL
jgi:DNA-directed RNA polymerase specialized sigma24 family protein